MPDTTRQKKQSRAASNSRSSQAHLPADANAGEAALDYFTLYAREKPEVVAMWAFGLGFVLGWKLRIF
jgi:hypothetical protein